MRTLCCLSWLPFLFLSACKTIPLYHQASFAKPKTIPQKKRNVRQYLEKPTYQFYGKPGDKIRFSILHSSLPKYHDLAIDPNGSISFPYAGYIKVSGRNLQTIHHEIVGKLKTFFNEPRIHLQWSSILSSKVNVLGLVNRPGTFVVLGPTRLSEILARTGGIRRIINGPDAGRVQADLHHSFVRRPKKGSITPDFQALLRGDHQQDIWILPGDTIVLPPAINHTYIGLGELKNPQYFKHHAPMNILQFIAKCGGFSEKASGQLFLIRGSYSKPQVFHVPMAKIMKGQINNFLLKPGDIIYASKSSFIQFTDVIQRIIPLVSLIFDGYRTFSGTLTLPVTVKKE